MSVENLLGAKEAEDRRLQRVLDPERTGSVSLSRLHALADEAGLDRTAPVVQAELAALCSGSGSGSSGPSSLSGGARTTADGGGAGSIPFKLLANLANSPPTASIMQRLLSNSLAIPNFRQFCEEVVALFEGVRADNSGELAQYIPELALVDPDKFGLAICTVDGQVFVYGDQDAFPLQSCVKPFVYALACDEHGLAHVHERVGREPSGVAFNAFSLGRQNKPHNPMVNSGAFVTHSLVRSHLRASQRMSYLLSQFAHIAGETKMGFDQPTYLSERETADKNFSIAYFMKSQGALPPDWDVPSNLEVSGVP